MAISTIPYLIIIALAGFIRLRMRYDRIVSWGMFLLVAFLFADYCSNALLNNNVGFSFLWNKTKIGDMAVSFLPASSDNYLIIPLFFISLMTILNNNIFHYEEKRSQFNSIIILNFVTLCMLICSENYVQLITSVFVSDILGYIILKDVDSSRRYVIYNLFSDMCLFMVMALVCGKIQGLELNSLINYKEIGRHRDFVGIVTAFAVFIKCGCFLFQTYLQDLTSARFQRMSAVNLLFSPLVGVLLLLKLHNLLQVSNLFIPIFNIMIILTFLSGIIYFIIKDNISKKMVCLNMAFISMLMYMLKANGFQISVLFSYYLGITYFYNLLFFKIYLYQNREEKVSRMLNGRETNALPLQTIFVQAIFLSYVFVKIIQEIATLLENNKLIWLSIIIILAVGIVLNHIYRSPTSRKLDYLNHNPKRIWSFIANTICLLVFGYLFKIYNWQAVVFFVGYIGIIACPLWKALCALYNKEWLQKEDVSKSLFYYILVEPLKYISRIFWLIIDFMLSEKVITAIFSKINKIIVSVFFKINSQKNSAEILFIIIGIIAFMISYYWRLLNE